MRVESASPELAGKEDFVCTDRKVGAQLEAKSKDSKDRNGLQARSHEILEQEVPQYAELRVDFDSFFRTVF